VIARKRIVALTVTVALVTPAAIFVLAPPAGAVANQISTIAGIDVSSGYTQDGIAATSSELNFASSMAVDSSGNVLIADSSNHRVRVVAKSATNPGYSLSGCAGSCTWNAGDIFTIAGDGTSSYNGDGIPATSAELAYPNGVAVDGSGNVLIGDTNNSRIRVIALSGSNPGYPLSGNGTDCPSGVCTWTVSDIFTVAGTGTPGDNVDGIAAGTADLNTPYGVAVDSQNNVLIADTGNHRVRVVAVSGSNPGYPLSGSGADCPGGICSWTVGDIFTIAGTGTPGYLPNDDGFAAGSAELAVPTDVAVDSNYNVMVDDHGNARARVVAVSGSNPGYPLSGSGADCGSGCTWTPGDIFTVAGNGTTTYTGDGIPAGTAEIASTGVALDAQRNVLLADYSNHRVRVVAVSALNPGYALRNQDCPGGVCTWTTGDIFTVAGVGSSGFNGDGIAATSAELAYPTDVAVDGSGNLLIADSVNNAIRKVLVGPALAGFTVPANVGGPYGYDTGYSVNNSVTIGASGTWCFSASPSDCYTGDGDGSLNPGGAGYLAPTIIGASLVGRIGTSGPWTFIGQTTPTAFNGTGELYLAMNDNLASYGDNTGSLTVTINAELNMFSEYQGDGPVMAGTDVSWDGTAVNTGATTLTNAGIVVSLGTSQTTVPKWQTTDTSFNPTGDPQPCVLFLAPYYLCELGSLPPGYFTTVTVDTITTKALAPQILTDTFALFADQTGSLLPGPPANASQEIDGLEFHITAPNAVQEGQPLTISGWSRNTSATDTLHSLVAFGGMDKGSITSATNCSFTNNAGGGATDRCPPNGTVSLPAGADTSASPAVVHIDTNGLAGQTIHYHAVVTSPDLGGNSQTANFSVFVTPSPGNIAITAPANGATLAGGVSNALTAFPVANTGHAVTSVEFWDGPPNGVGSTLLENVAAPGPYTTTIPANSLSSGFHVLYAQLDQSASAFHPTQGVAVNVAGAPTININPPSGFNSGDTLDISQTFTAAVHASAPATIRSVVWQIDGATPTPIAVPSLATSPYTAIVDPASLVIPDGFHTLTATVTDSAGQSTTSAGFDFTVPTATLSMGPITTSASEVTPGGDAAWTVEVDNTSANIAHHATLTLNATATDALNVTTNLTFDTAAINGTLQKVPTAPTCAAGTGASLICTLPDVPGGAGVQFPVFVNTGPVSVGSTINGGAIAAAANAVATATSSLGAVSVISCGTDCKEGVAAAGTSFDSGTDSSGTNDVSVTLSQGLASTAHGVKIGHPFRLASGGLRHTRITFRPRLELAAAVKVTLSTVDPLTAPDPIDTTHLCNVANPCFGKISGIDGDFSPFTDRTDPIVVVIIAKWGDTVPAGTSIWMQKPAVGANPLPAAIKLPACVINASTRAFNTPCLLPEIVKSLTVGATTTKTTYDTVLFTGNDPHFARR
jgi:hypothetical protein